MFVVVVYVEEVKLDSNIETLSKKSNTTEHPSRCINRSFSVYEEEIQ